MSHTVVVNLSASELPRIIAECGGRFFCVRFRKRTTGEERVMNCRQRVRRHLRGGEPAYNFRQRGLISVFDMRARDYRCFPLDGVRELRAGGKHYVVVRK